MYESWELPVNRWEEALTRAETNSERETVCPVNSIFKFRTSY
jgi:hypothetical protein